MEDVARRARVARASLYNHFGSKEALYQEVVARRMTQLALRLEESLGTERDPVRNLRRCVVHPFMFFVKYPSFLLLWRRHELRNRGDGAAAEPWPGNGVLDGLRDRLAGLIRGVLCEGIRRGAFHSVDPEGTSRLILGAVEGMAAALLGLPVDDPRVGRAREELYAFVSRSLLRRTERASSATGDEAGSAPLAGRPDAEGGTQLAGSVGGDAGGRDS
jgi:AcrR family transcriptional regulator